MKFLPGIKHPKAIYPKVEKIVIRLVIKHPEWGCRRISRELLAKGKKLSYVQVNGLLNRLGAENYDRRINFARNYSGPGRLQADIRNEIVGKSLEGERISKLSKDYRVSRDTIYRWINKSNQGGSLKDGYLVSVDHPRAIYPKITQNVLDLVVANPEYSVHTLTKLVPASSWTVWSILNRNHLNTYNLRLEYSRSAVVTAEQKVSPTGIFGRIRSVFETFVPNLAPAPPPSPNVLVKTFAISLISTLLISLTSIWWISVVTSAPNFVSSVGMIFAFIALGFGTFFFVYSLKYYISLAIVLSRSQNEVLEGNERPTAPGLRSDLDNLKLTKHPFVSVQVALYNEKNVVERLAKAITSFDYPNYEAMLVDDSTDETSDKITTFQKSFLFKGEELKITRGDGWTLTEVGVREGVTLKHLHRTSREGYKGGALALALTLADKRTEYVSIFDADFVPYTDSLNLFLKYFQLKDDPKTAAVQGYQWHVLNKSENWITRGVRSEYSGSYVIERAGTEIYGGLKQISGSVYMIKKSVLEEIGWGTSITEDFELTLKLYEKGYKVIYTPYIQAPAECVSTLRRLIRQRMRWAEGHSFNIKKMLVSLLASPKLSLSEKFETVYLAPYYLQAMFFLVGTMCWLVAETVFRVRLPFWTELWGWSLVLTNMISLPLLNSVGLFLEESEQKDYSGIPSFIALSYIVVPFQAYAAVKGFLEKSEGPWFRTPKTGKVTDIFTRNKFYRFIQGIMPGKVEGLNQSLSSALSPYLALATANNRFDRFDIRRQKNRKWIGKTVISMVLMVSILLNSFAFGVKPVKAAGWYDNAWLYRVKLTIDHTKVGADQTDFPVYVDLANMPAGFHTNVNQTDARDIRVTKDDGTTELPREVVFYTAASDIGELHFKYTGTLSSSTNTDVYIYYGNSAASDYATNHAMGAQNVWDSNYVGVYHLNETTSTRYDSTNKDHDLSVSATVGYSTSGKLGTTASFTVAGNLYRADANLSTDFPGKSSQTTTSFSSSYWVKPKAFGQNDWLGKRVSNDGWQYYAPTNQVAFRYKSGTTDYSTLSAASSMTTNNWYYVSGVHDATNDIDYVYLNGAESGKQTSRSNDPNATSASFMLGGTQQWPNELNGLMDEVRVSKSARSATWVSTEYNNQNSPATFFSTWGAEESVPELTILLFPIALGVPFIVKYMRRKKEQALAYA